MKHVLLIATILIYNLTANASLILKPDAQVEKLPEQLEIVTFSTSEHLEPFYIIINNKLLQLKINSITTESALLQVYHLSGNYSERKGNNCSEQHIVDLKADVRIENIENENYITPGTTFTLTSKYQEDSCHSAVEVEERIYQ